MIETLIKKFFIDFECIPNCRVFPYVNCNNKNLKIFFSKKFKRSREFFLVFFIKGKVDIFFDILFTSFFFKKYRHEMGSMQYK